MNKLNRQSIRYALTTTNTISSIAVAIHVLSMPVYDTPLIPSKESREGTDMKSPGIEQGAPCRLEPASKIVKG